MRRLLAFLFFISTPFLLKAQLFADSVRSTFLKIKMPTGTIRTKSADSIRITTALLDSFMITRDYTLNNLKAEVFYLRAHDSLRVNYDSLRARLLLGRFAINRVTGSDFYAIKKDSLTYLAVIKPVGDQTMVSLKQFSVASSSSSFTQMNKLVANDRTNNVEFGRAVAITNNYAVVGAQLEDNDADGKNPKADAGAAYIYQRGTDNKWKQVQKIVAADRAAGANFGWSVGISGNTIVVGAIYERFDASGRNESSSEGAAYVFERGTDGVWKQSQKLLSSDRSGYNYFGTSVGIDGNIIVVGAPGHSRDSTERQEGYVGDAGAIFVFERRGNNWRRTYKLLASDREHGGSMGNSVAINGSRVIAGAWAHDFGLEGQERMEACGAAYIWERMDDGKWTRAQKLVASDRSGWDEFGFSVAINGDHAVVGARNVSLNKGDENNHLYTGEAYIFSRNENGEWKEEIALLPEDRKEGNLFGHSVGVSGNYVIIGSSRGDTKKNDVGVIYLYWKNSQDKWVLSQKFSSLDEGTYSNFGHAVAIHNGFIISGAYVEWRDAAGKNDLSNSGAAYVFMRNDKSNTNAKPVTPKQVPKTGPKKTN